MTRTRKLVGAALLGLIVVVGVIVGRVRQVTPPHRVLAAGIYENNAAYLQGTPIATTSPTAGNPLVYGGSTWAPAATIGVSAIAPGTDGQGLFTNGSGATAWASFSSDLSCSTSTAGSCTVADINGNATISGALVKGDGIFAGSTSSYSEAAFSGDFTCSTSTVGLCTIADINGQVVTGATTSGATGAQTVLQAQGSTNASGTGGNFGIEGGSASGGTSGTPGNPFMEWLAPSGAGTEAGAEFVRNGVAYGFIQGLVGTATSYSALYLGVSITPTATNSAIYSSSTETVVNAPSGTLYGTIGGTVAYSVGASAIQLGETSTNPTLTLNATAVTGTQLVTTGLSTLSALGVYQFAPITYNGVSYQIVLTR